MTASPTTFQLFPGYGPAQNHPLIDLFQAGLEKILGIRQCQKLYAEIDHTANPLDFAGLTLEKLGAGYRVAEPDQRRIPASGSCILIANHLFGGIEGLALLDLLAKIRPDFKVMANFMLARIPQLQPQLISVDPFGGEAAARTNLAPLRQSLNWLKQGGLLVIFPAGEVASWQSRQQGVTDPAWSSTLPRLVRMSKAPVLPVFFTGQNGRFFQWAGRLHPRLRTLLLPRMLLNKRQHTLELHIGNLLPPARLSRIDDDQKLNDYLRLRTYALALKIGRSDQSDRVAQAAPLPLINPPDQQRLEAEIAGLREKNLLLSSGEFEVLLSRGDEAFHLLLEIGRLRELTFRQVGEGTGRSLDLDAFDSTYNHLFVWHREKREVVGAYRIGQVDRLLAKGGTRALYSSTLFGFKPQLFKRLEFSLELGRSFVRPEYQRSYAPLLLLWKGIGQFLVANPQYRYLFGPVSISNDYSSNSRQLMTSALSRHFLVGGLAHLVAPHQPVSLKPLRISGVSSGQADPLLRDMDEISALVADFEPDSKGIPVLLRHYLNLGGKLLAFNLDRKFSDVIDGLLLVDLHQTEPRQLQRYLGREGLQIYCSAQLKAEARCA